MTIMAAAESWILLCLFSVSQLQVELDNLMLHLVFTQRGGEDLQSDLKAMQNVRHRAGAQKNQAEEQKLQQVGNIWGLVVHRC